MNTGKKEPTTRTLEKEITEIDCRESLDRFLEKTASSRAHLSFLAYFRSLEKVKAVPDAVLQKKSDIERTYFYHLMSGAKTPGRDKIFRLCLAAGLDDTECRRALEAAGQPVFYAKNRRDTVIRFAIRQHLSVQDTNLLLAEYHLDALG